METDGAGAALRTTSRAPNFSQSPEEPTTVRCHTPVVQSVRVGMCRVTEVQDVRRPEAEILSQPRCVHVS